MSWTIGYKYKLIGTTAFSEIEDDTGGDYWIVKVSLGDVKAQLKKMDLQDSLVVGSLIIFETE